MYLDELPDMSILLARIYNTIAARYPEIISVKKRILRPSNEQRIYVPSRPTHIDILQVHPEMVLGTVILQLPMGIIERYMSINSLTYRIPHGLEAIILDYAQWDAILNELQLHHEMMQLNAFMLSGVLAQVGDILTQTSRSAVKSLIHRYVRLQTMSDLEENLLDFISLRCNYSRSTIYQIVTEHRKNGRIEMQEGKLTRIVTALD